MNSELDFEAVIGRLKEALGKDKDAEVADVLGMSRQSFSNRKKIGSIPYEEIVSRAAIEDLDLVYVFTGARAPRGGLAVAQESANYGGPAEVNVELLQKVLCAVDKELAERELAVTTKKRAELVAYLYDHFMARGAVDPDRFSRFMDLVLER